MSKRLVVGSVGTCLPDLAPLHDPATSQICPSFWQLPDAGNQILERKQQEPTTTSTVIQIPKGTTCTKHPYRSYFLPSQSRPQFGYARLASRLPVRTCCTGKCLSKHHDCNTRPFKPGVGNVSAEPACSVEPASISDADFGKSLPATRHPRRTQSQSNGALNIVMCPSEQVAIGLLDALA